jgi:multiple antibiotic resistance protein
VIATLHRFCEITFVAFAGLFAIVNPLGSAPIFLAKTADLSSERRASLIGPVTLYSFVLLTASTLIGSHVLDFFSVSIPIVQVAGGLVLSSMGWSLLNEPVSRLGESSDAAAAAEDLRDRIFYPLTMPITVGPGSISAAITLGANTHQSVRGRLFTLAAHLVGILMVAASVYLCYRYAEPIIKRLGLTGTAVLIRLSAFIVFCIGVQICWNGIHALILPLVS